MSENIKYMPPESKQYTPDELREREERIEELILFVRLDWEQEEWLALKGPNGQRLESASEVLSQDERFLSSQLSDLLMEHPEEIHHFLHGNYRFRTPLLREWDGEIKELGPLGRVHISALRYFRLFEARQTFTFIGKFVNRWLDKIRAEEKKVEDSKGTSEILRSANADFNASAPLPTSYFEIDDAFRLSPRLQNDTFRMLEEVQIFKVRLCLCCEDVFWANRSDARSCSLWCSNVTSSREYERRKSNELKRNRREVKVADLREQYLEKVVFINEQQDIYATPVDANGVDDESLVLQKNTEVTIKDIKVCDSDEMPIRFELSRADGSCGQVCIPYNNHFAFELGKVFYVELGELVLA